MCQVKRLRCCSHAEPIAIGFISASCEIPNLQWFQILKQVQNDCAYNDRTWNDSAYNDCTLLKLRQFAFKVIDDVYFNRVNAFYVGNVTADPVADIDQVQELFKPAFAFCSNVGNTTG